MLKFSRKTFILTNMFKEAKKSAFGVGTVVITSTSILTLYNDAEANIISVFLFGFLTSLIQNYTISNFGFNMMSLFALTAEYIVIKFQLSFAFLRSRDDQKMSVLLNFAKEHNKVCNLVTAFYKIAKHVMGAIVFGCTPLFCIYFFMAVYGDLDVISRMIGLNFFANILALVSFFNYQVAKIAKEVSENTFKLKF